jgi:hypothetical protein
MNEEIKAALSTGEQVLWSGRPRQGLVVRGTDAAQIPFSLLWCGFAIFWELSVIKSPNTSPFFVLWGIPFVAVGVYLVIGRFFTEAIQRSRTYYAVTSERVVIVSGVFNKKIKSLNLKTLMDLSLSEGRSRQGTITFGAQPQRAFMFGGGWPGSEQYLAPRFDLIDNAKSVFETIQRAQQAV